MIVVIGSGPSGVAAASALLDEGLGVTMFDVGHTIEAAVDRQSPGREVNEEWSASDVKRVFGSTFAYALDEMRQDTQQGTRCVQSFARGGLSHVWGAAVLPSRARDLIGWPRDACQLDEHYAAVGQLMPIAAAADDLSTAFPLYAPSLPPLRASRQASALLQRLTSGRAALDDVGVSFGQSRLAVRSVATSGTTGCQYTGRCLTGCPHGAIWSSSEALDTMRRHPRFVYRPGVRVDSIAGRTPSGGLELRSTLDDGSTETIEASRVLVACGPLATARLLLHSLNAYDRPTTLRYQPYFLLPMLAADAVSDVESESLHTLAQAFVEIDNPAVSPHTVHLQYYTFNGFIQQRVASVTRLLGPLDATVQRRLVGRLLAVQGYLHSDTAPGITLTAHPGRDRARLQLRAGPPPVDAVRNVTRFLFRHRRHLGATPISPMLQLGLPGDGNHCGGQFPMRDRPSGLETDVHGQLHELPGVHLVDSSVLPSLPATTFTYTVMANAHRIARAVARGRTS